MEKLTLLLAIAALVIATLNALDLRDLRRKVGTILPLGQALAKHHLDDAPQHAAPDPWIAAVQQWLATAPQVPLTTDTILANALPGTAATRQASARITAVMKALGYRATRVRLPGQETLTRVFQPLPGTVVELQP